MLLFYFFLLSMENVLRFEIVTNPKINDRKKFLKRKMRSKPINAATNSMLKSTQQQKWTKKAEKRSKTPDKEKL